MGEIAEMMLDGTLCQGCGVYRKGRHDGIPGYCNSCQREANVFRNIAEHAAAQKAKCPTCGKKVKAVGLADHIRDAHTSKEQPHD